MKKGLTEIVFIIDKSGSMSGLESDTIGGFNSLLKKQKKEDGEALISTVFFSDRSKVIHNRVDIKEVKELTENDYICGGCTALLDAIGEAINHINKVRRYEREENRPERTLFVITTDGYENSSCEYNYKSVRKMIDIAKEKNNWEFLFLGANIDAEEEAEKFGIDREYATSYHCDEAGIETNYETISETISCFRGEARKIDKNWKKKIEDDYKKRK